MSSSVHALFHKATSTLTYVVWDELSRDAVVIDPVLDFDPVTQMLAGAGTGGADLESLRRFLEAKELRVHWVLDTHAHADHLSAGRELKAAGLAMAWGMSTRMHEVFGTFAKIFAWPKGLRLQDLGVDRFFADGEKFRAGSLRLRALATPGHTSACTTFLIQGDSASDRVPAKLFAGDALMMPDSGVGRCDFPGGSASQLYDSIWGKLYALPDDYEIFVGHDYQPGGRPLRYRTTVGEQRASNIHLSGSTSREDFVRFREARDKTLTPPRLLNPSLDWNLGAHQMVKRPNSVAKARVAE